MKKGKFIVFEGVSGTGKETQAKLLQKFLKKKGIFSKIVFHPSPELKPALRKASSVGEQIKLLAQDREDRVKKVIRPTILRGEWIISLRNYVSAMVYQGDTGIIKKIDISPDYLFYFDISPKVAMERIVSRGETRGKYEKLMVLEEKRKKYQEVLKNIPHIRIDASQSIDRVSARITDEIILFITKNP